MIRSHLIACALICLSTSSFAQLGGLRINRNILKAGSDAVSAASLTDEQVVAYTKQAVQEMDRTNPVAPDSDTYAKRLAKIVKNHREIDGLPINYKVYLVRDVNTFACADGSVRVFAGLMDMMTDDELMAVMGHEIGHVINHDTRDAMKAALNRSALRNAAASTSGTAGQLSRSELGGLADNMLGASFSRKQESEADDFSYQFLKKNNYDVLALATSFEKLEKLSEGNQQKGIDKLMSSHPDSGKRAKRVREQAKKDGLIK